MRWPVDISTVTQEFGAYPNPDYQPDGHTGMDFGVDIGTPVRAAGAGTVLWAGWSQGLGWPNPYYIAIDFDGPANGDQSAGIVVVIDHGPYATLYAHLEQTGLNPGDTVAEGEIIGQTGNTGRSSGPHLHFEMLPDGWDVTAKWYGRINPRTVITLLKTQSTREAIMSWNTQIQEYKKDGKTKAGTKTAAFILGNLNQWVTRILEGQAAIRRDIKELRKIVESK